MRRTRPQQVLVSRRLLFSLVSHAINYGKTRVQANAQDTYWAVEQVLIDAAEAKVLLAKQEGGRR